MAAFFYWAGARVCDSTFSCAIRKNSYVVGKSLLPGENFLIQADAAETDADNGG